MLDDPGANPVSYKIIQRRLAQTITGGYRDRIGRRCFEYAASTGGLGLLLEIGCFEGNKAETHTLVPIVRQFRARHGIEGVEMVITADAGMLSASDLTVLDEAGLKFIDGSGSRKRRVV
ncbi:hypothetical protein G6038_14940 [Rhodococcus sp. 14C212]|nr:hypothetical protein [Rhodococcus sp. 14C212]